MSNRRRIPEDTAEYARWLAAEIAGRYRPTWFEPSTAMFLSMALEGYAELLDRKAASELNFSVTSFDDAGGKPRDRRRGRHRGRMGRLQRGDRQTNRRTPGSASEGTRHRGVSS